MRTPALLLAAAAAVAVAAGVALRSRDADSERPPTEVRTVTVRNACDHDVWLFYGRSPPVRPQDALELPDDASTAQPMLEGDVIWLLDDARDVLDHVTIGAATSTVEVTPSCRTIEAR